MVDLPCLPSQTFWCLAVPNDPTKRESQPTIEEIILAEKPEHAKEQMEGFWNSKCAVILSQDDVSALLSKFKQTPVSFDGVKLPQPSLFDKLVGRKIQDRDKNERFYVIGSDASGNESDVVVEAKSLPVAYLAASAEKPGFIPSSAYSETQLATLLATMENARTGRINVVRAIAATEKMDVVREASAALSRSLGI